MATPDMCDNPCCGNREVHVYNDYTTGWKLESGHLITLCDSCGYAFRHGTFCEQYHSEEPGWRNCATCDKRLHCGCIASKSLVVLQPLGGVKCVDCARLEDANPSGSGSSNELRSVPENNGGIANDMGNAIMTESESRNMPLAFNPRDLPPILGPTPPTFSRYVISRYGPLITDQELQQLSEAPNGTIVPLFEKRLSQSDAGRRGRFIIPKVCAEAYFPAISQPEGIPMTIEDVHGNEWVVQFRFWRNNNSRMYALEGVTPCLQSMQLEPGDIVLFGRKEPEGKYVMGFRKPWNSSVQAPSVTGKTSVLLFSETRQIGEQWLQCDLCSKWRQIPFEMHISATNWKCADNIPNSKLCSDPEGNTPIELQTHMNQEQGVTDDDQIPEDRSSD